jgi:hypothetical protein
LREGRHEVFLVRPAAAVERFAPGPDMADRVCGRLLELAHAARPALS